MPRPDGLRWFALRLVLLLPPAYLAWHFLQPGVIDSLWRLSDLAWPRLFRDGLVSVEPREQHWIIRTGWPLRGEPGAPLQQATTLVSMTMVKRMLSGFPLLLALILALLVVRRRGWIAPLLLGLAAWWTVSWVAITGYAWHMLAVLSTGRVSYVEPTLVPPPFKVTLPPYPAWEYYLSGYAQYLALLIVPVAAPIMIWAWVCRRDVRRLIIRVQRRYRKRR